MLWSWDSCWCSLTPNTFQDIFFQIPSPPLCQQDSTDGHFSHSSHVAKSNRTWSISSPSFLWLFLSNSCGSSACVGWYYGRASENISKRSDEFNMKHIQTRIQFTVRHHHLIKASVIFHLLHLHVEEKWEGALPLAAWLGVSSEPLVMRERGQTECEVYFTRYHWNCFQKE